VTVYVDNVRIPATVGRRHAHWSHLTADTQDELHAFAELLGLRRAWFQRGKSYAGRPPVGWHYDVTDDMRLQALALGAQPVTMRDLAAILSARRAVSSAQLRPLFGDAGVAAGEQDQVRGDDDAGQVDEQLER
jgi:Protein of unknown function (DUF4031)